MPNIKFEVQPLFSTPMFRADVSQAISAEQVDFIKNLPMQKNQVNLISQNLYIFELPELKTINEVVHDSLNAYANDVMGITQKISVTQSWALINEPGVGMHGHSHSNSLVSGSLYYAPLPEPQSRMVFQRHSGYRQIELNPEPDKRNIFNTTVNVVEPRQGDIVMFPSDLTHMVETNETDQPRYSIAFNSFVRGKIGSLRDVSELSV